jgi:Zn-dependent protease with chaperone function
MTRRPGRTSLALALPALVFIIYGATRVAAPLGLLGLLFDEPLGFAAIAAATSLVLAGLLMVPRVQIAVSRMLAGASRPPTGAEWSRLEPILERLAAPAGFDTGDLIVRVQDQPDINAGAGAGRLLFLTRGALALEDDRLEAILAHELGHHRGLHPVLTMVVWWLSLPGEALAAVYRLLRRATGGLAVRLGGLGRLLGVPLMLLVVAWQLSVMWLHYLGELLAQRAARVSEFEADATAAGWGYARPLAAALEAAGARDAEPGGTIARLRADHPPLEERLRRLGGAYAPS